MTNGLWRGLASLSIAAGLALIAAPAMATVSFDCSVMTSTGALNTFLEGIGDGSFTTQTIKGTCNGNIAPPSDITLVADVSGSTISGTVTIGGRNTTLSGFIIDGGSSFNHSAIIVQNTGSEATLTNLTIQNWTGSNNGAVSVVQGGTLIMNGGSIKASTTLGGFFFASVFAGSNSFASISNVEITGNFGGVTLVESKATLTSVNIHANNGGNAVSATQSDFQVSGGTIAGSTIESTPTIALIRSSMISNGATIIGPNLANAIYATPGSVAKLIGTTVNNNDAADATILIADGSTLLSDGSNTISISATNGTAIAVTNASTFRERNEAEIGITLGADSITGAGSIQMQSNMELGTGATSPSIWTGAIAVAQNSSLRMDGGFTVTGTVTLGQGSNGFFNKTAGGNNVITGGLTCGGTSTSHVVGPGSVTKTGGGAAATLVATGVGCYGF